MSVKKKKTKKQIENRLLDRRQFLMGSSGAFLSLPPLLSLMSSAAHAQAINEKVVRSVIYVGELGIERSLMFPSSPLANLDPVVGQLNMKSKLLSAIPGDLSYMIDRASFSGLYDYMNVVHGLSLTGGLYQGHNHSVLSGIHSTLRNPTFGRSIDTVMEKSLSVYGADSTAALKALRIKTKYNNFSWDTQGGRKIANSALIGDANVFNTLFASLGDGGPPLITNDMENQELVVDKVYNEIKALQNNSRISKSDKNLVDRYVSGLFDLQKKIIATNSGGATCAKPTSMTLQAGTSGNGYQFPYHLGWNRPNLRLLFENYNEMIKLAFSCDLTRVVYMQNSIISDLPVGHGLVGGLHHECPSAEESANRQKWGLLKMRDLAQTLKNTPDPLNTGDNILDNSTILFTNELGAWTTSHNTSNMPCVIFGKGGGKIRSGYYVDARQNPGSSSRFGEPGRPYKQMLQMIMRSMGITKAEYSLYGDGSGYGEFKPGINQFGHNYPTVYSAYASEHNDPLPFLSI
jgi:hypothetical protein